MPYPSPPINPTDNQDGLTLLELLLVVTILSGIAWMSLGYVSNNADQLRFEDTRNRLAAIKRGILGDSSRTINGGPEIRGYVADMGSLPPHLNALLAEDFCQNDSDKTSSSDCSSPGIWSEGHVTYDQPSYAYNATYGLWSGWNGPYLQATELLGAPKFRDGWGRADYTTNNYGWNVVVGDDLQVQSYGLDAISGGNGYEADYPPSGSEVLVAANEYRLLITDSSGAGGLRVDFGSPAGPFPSSQLCMKVAYRKKGTITELESIGSYTDTWDGTAKTTVFSFDDDLVSATNDTYFPLGQMVFGIFTHNGTICTDNTYPTAGYPKWTPFTVVPGATLQPLSWKIP